MKKIEKRAIMCLLLAGFLALGLGIFTYRYVAYGEDWALFGGNRHVYNSKGHLAKGTLYDSSGTFLMSNAGGKMSFSDNVAARKAVVHLTGDRQENISTGANRALKKQLAGYNLLTGTYTTLGKGRDVFLTIDTDVCKTANAALAGRRGTVGVYNYKTGEIVCLVSSPNYDPLNPPSLGAGDTSGMYINRFFSAKFPPGSVFKLVTSAAAIETLNDYNSWTVTCTGRVDYGPDKVTCPSSHGTVNLKKALAVSCNCYFGKLTERLGADTMSRYVKKIRLDKDQSVSGMSLLPGNFEFPDGGVRLAWAGIGQYNDQLNPCTMMTYMGAIAADGLAVRPEIVKDVTFANGVPSQLPGSPKTIEMIDPATAVILKNMMRNNVKNNYGSGNFPGLKICAKSGTAEVGKGKAPNAWFVGFLDDEANPYAFVVLVENGGWGSRVAGSVANQVLQKIVK